MTKTNREATVARLERPERGGEEYRPVPLLPDGIRRAKTRDRSEVGEQSEDT